MFQGFEQKYPEYEVITPHTNLKFTIRSLTTAEELKIKTSLTDKNTLTEILNKTLYDCLVQKPKVIDSFESFLSNLTLTDREALFTGWYHCSYGNIVENIPVVCPSCGHNFTINYDLSIGGRFEPYSGKELEILDKEVEVDLDVAPAKIVIKVPTMKDELELTKSFFSENQEDDILNMLLYTKKIYYFEPNDKSRKNPIPIDNIADTIFALKSLVPRDRRKLRGAYADNFGKYGLWLEYNTKCINCGNSFTGEVGLLQYFFREVYTG